MAWSFSAHRPVYYQVAERIKHSILSGKYSPGEQIPSVRQLALEAAVNPNTVQHAFSHLESRGLIEARGTIGRFVTEDASVIEECRVSEAEELIGNFLDSAERLRISNDKLLDILTHKIEQKANKEDSNEHS